MLKSKNATPKNAVIECSHNQTVLVVFPTLFEFVIFVVAWKMGLPGGCGLDDGEPLFGSFVAVVSCLHIPHVRLKGVAAASNAHLCEVAACIFGLRKSWVN